ncbi:MAG TPA: hypothetical protein VGL53_24525, partial [Bryobacteraceae bacterium]
KFAGGGFLRSLSVSVVSILALAVLVSLVTKRVNYSPVTNGGEGVVLHVEVQLPPNWAEDADNITQFGCALNPNGDRSAGEVHSSRIQQPKNSRAIVPCTFALRSTRKNRRISLTIQGAGGSIGPPAGRAWLDVTLPDDWSLELNKPWGQWARGTDAGAVIPSDYQFRYRLESENISRTKDQAEREVRLKERWRQFRSLAPNAPLERYLAAFEPDPDNVAASEIPPEVVAKLAVLVKKNPSGFEEALGSDDREVVRRAVYALSATPQIPREITPALVDAGHQVVSYIDSARDKNLAWANDDADKDALPFLDRWDLALDHAEPPINRADFLAILDDMQKASGKRHSTFRTDLPSRVAMKIDEMTAKRR